MITNGSVCWGRCMFVLLFSPDDSRTVDQIVLEDLQPWLHMIHTQSPGAHIFVACSRAESPQRHQPEEDPLTWRQRVKLLAKGVEQKVPDTCRYCYTGWIRKEQACALAQNIGICVALSLRVSKQRSSVVDCRNFTPLHTSNRRLFSVFSLYPIICLRQSPKSPLFIVSVTVLNSSVQNGDCCRLKVMCICGFVHRCCIIHM
jgi:hypothetical protein